MTYRDDRESLRARNEHLEQELADARLEIERLRGGPEPVAAPVAVADGFVTARLRWAAWGSTYAFFALGAAAIGGARHGTFEIAVVTPSLVAGALSVGFGTLVLHRAAKTDFARIAFETLFYLPFILFIPGIGALMALWRGVVLFRGRLGASVVTVNGEETHYDALDVGHAGAPLSVFFFAFALLQLAALLRLR